MKKSQWGSIHCSSFLYVCFGREKLFVKSCHLVYRANPVYGINGMNYTLQYHCYVGEVPLRSDIHVYFSLDTQPPGWGPIILKSIWANMTLDMSETVHRTSLSLYLITWFNLFGFQRIHLSQEQMRWRRNYMTWKESWGMKDFCS